MTNEEFRFWMRGFVELCSPQSLTLKQAYIIKNHLNLVIAATGKLDAVNEETYAFTCELIEMKKPDTTHKAEDVAQFESRFLARVNIR